MDQKTLEQRRIRILNYKTMFFTPTKQDYSKQVEKINVEKNEKRRRGMGNKVGLVTLLDIEWKEPNHGFWWNF